MVKYRLESIAWVVFFCFFAALIAGCSGGGGESALETEEQRHILDVKATVTFPASSPLDNTNTSVLCDGEVSPLDSANQADITIITNKVMDVSVLLPSRDGVEPPTVYLNTTVMPGETQVNLNIEETAASLVMTGVDHRYLVDPTTASWVKSVVKRHSTDFIDDLAQKIAHDHYLLRPDTIKNALGPLFAQAVADSDAALQVLYDPDNTLTAPRLSKALASIPAGADDFGDFYITYDRSPPLRSFVFIPPGLLGNGKLTFTNSSMLPVVTRITDTVNNEVIKDIPDSFMGQAFGPDILSPTNGPFGLPLPTWESIDNGTRNIHVDVFTPGLLDFSDTSYFEAGSPCGPLLARASFSGAIKPLLGVILPSGATNAVSETIFSILLRADVFEHILYHWPRGEFTQGVTAVWDGINTTNVISEIVEMLVKNGFLKGDIAPMLAAQLGLKIVTAKIAIASAGISIAALSKGLVETPSKVSYDLIYPAGLQDLVPHMMQKLSEDDTNSQEFTLTGHGLSAIQFDSETHTARLLLEAFTKEDEKVEEAWLDQEFGYSIQTVSSLDTLTFKLPDTWVGLDTAIKYVRMTVHHGYIAPGWLAGYTDWTNYLETVELPYYESSIEKFTIYLTQDIKITSVEKTLLEKGDLIIINGQGFSSDDSGLENEVYFVDKDKQPVYASILSSSETRLSAYVPSALKLNDSSELVQQHVGSSSVYVELADGTQSNHVWVALIPDPVTFYPEPVSNEMTYKDSMVRLFQASNVPIYASINDSNYNLYRSPLTIAETSKITAYAQMVVDGVIYDSRSTTRNYITCQKGETFVPYPHGAQCVEIQNQDLMPRRYCPLDNQLYDGPIETPFGCATCSYSWMIGGTDQLAVEKHMDRSQTAVFSITQFWAQPEGRPSNVWRPTANYHFCPDGSFGTTCSD